MRRQLAIIGLAIGALMVMPTTVLAVGTLDQQQTTYDGFSSNSSQCAAQTFTAGLYGHLDRVSLYVRNITGHPVMPIEIRNTVGGVPGSTVLASRTVSGADIPGTFSWIDFDFAARPLVEAGTTYAIVAPPLGPMDASPPPWGFEWGGAQQTISFDPYVGGRFHYANICDGPYGSQSSDLAFKTYVDTEGVFQPDGQIRVNFGGWVGGNVYNADAVGQSRSGEADPGNWVVFRMRIQNDGIVRDRFAVDADGVAVAGYRVRYFHGTSEITDAVNAGSYRTRLLAPGHRVAIEAWVKVRSNAALGSQVQRLLTFESVGDPLQVDAVKFTVTRR